MAEEKNTQPRISLSNLEPGQQFEGTVKRIELYGAFVDFGAERDGLVHISQLSESRVNNVTDVINEGDTITVWIQQVDPEQGRIGLTMVEPPERTLDDLKPDMILNGTVTKLAPYGAFVNVGVGRDGLVHISEMAEGRIGHPSDIVQEGEEIQVRVVKINRRKRQIELSLKNLEADQEGEMDLGEEEDFEPLTAMELAWRDAMEQQGHSLQVSTHHRGHRRKKSDIRRQQAEIIARTLNTRKS